MQWLRGYAAAVKGYTCNVQLFAVFSNYFFLCFHCHCGRLYGCCGLQHIRAVILLQAQSAGVIMEYSFFVMTRDFGVLDKWETHLFNNYSKACIAFVNLQKKHFEAKLGRKTWSTIALRDIDKIEKRTIEYGKPIVFDYKKTRMWRVFFATKKTGTIIESLTFNSETELCHVCMRMRNSLLQLYGQQFVYSEKLDKLVWEPYEIPDISAYNFFPRF